MTMKKGSRKRKDFRRISDPIKEKEARRERKAERAKKPEELLSEE